MSAGKRLTPPQSRKVNALVQRECCNCDNGHCILLDDGEECVCPQLISYSLLCKWFRIAVLPGDKLLYAELYKTEDRKKCTECGAFFASRSNHVKKVKSCQILPGLPEAYHEPAGSGAHEETPRPCYAIGAKTALIYAAFRAGKQCSRYRLPFPSKIGFYCVTKP